MNTFILTELFLLFNCYILNYTIIKLYDIIITFLVYIASIYAMPYKCVTCFLILIL